MSDSKRSFLAVEGVSLNFGGTKALDDVSFDVRPGEVLGIIGPNGAGKTSMLNCLNAVVRPQAGRIRFEDTEIVGLHPKQIIGLGIARTFQGPSLQPEATVAENILFGRDHRMRYGLVAALSYLGPARQEEERNRAKVEEIIAFLGIERLRHVEAGTLPWGLQRLVDIGRALAAEPRLLLLDEPTSGMTREEKSRVANFIVRMQAELGISQILIEHDARFVGDLCDRAVALDFGKVIATGPTNDVLNDPLVVSAYLGTVVDAAPA